MWEARAGRAFDADRHRSVRPSRLRPRLPAGVRRPSFRVLAPPLHALKAAHSGIIGDYLLWIVLGTTVIGGVWAITLR